MYAPKNTRHTASFTSLQSAGYKCVHVAHQQTDLVRLGARVEKYSNLRLDPYYYVKVAINSSVYIHVHPLRLCISCFRHGHQEGVSQKVSRIQLTIHTFSTKYFNSLLFQYHMLIQVDAQGEIEVSSSCLAPVTLARGVYALQGIAIGR